LVRACYLSVPLAQLPTGIQAGVIKMAPMKRPASTWAAAPQRKKPAAAKSSVDSKCEAVEKAILTPQFFPEPVRKMLAASIAMSLGVPKEERHPFQEQVGTMVGKVLAGMEADAKKTVALAQAQVAEVGGVKATLEATAEAATAELTAKSEAFDSAKTAVAQAADALKAAKTASLSAEAEQKTSSGELEAVASKKAKLESLSECFVQLKEGAKEEVKLSTAELMKACKEFQFDSSLMAVLPSALGKDASSQGCFDSIVINQVESEIAKKIASVGEMLEAADTSKAALTDKTASAASETTAASEKDAGCKAELEAAKTAQKEAEKASKDATKAVKDVEPGSQRAAKALESAAAALIALTEGPLAAYAALLELSNAPPPVEEPAEVPAVAMEAEMVISEATA